MSREARSRQRGATAMLFALVLPIVLGFVALVIDLGHGFQVHLQLRNAADAAALAGVRDLDGTTNGLVRARASATWVGGQHMADNSPVDLSASDVVLGNWNPTTRVFTPSSGSMPAWQVNAVEAIGHRDSLEGGAVATYFARVAFGALQMNVAARAIAVGGSPREACNFPLTLPACSIVGPDGTVRCNAMLTFGQATTDNVGFTLLTPDPPVSTSGINCEIANALGLGCNGHCDCSQPGCNEARSGESIYISNGNNLSQQVVDEINAAVAAAGPTGMFIQVPVLDSGTLDTTTCGSFQFNGAATIAGFVSLRILGASSGPPKTVSASVDCTRSDDEPPGGGGVFGMPTTDPLLVQ